MNRMAHLSALVTAFVLVACTAMQSADKSVSFVEPKDGATVTSPFKVVFAVKGMAVDPAGEIKADSGHHHLLIDLGPMPAGEAIPVARRNAPALRQGADRRRSHPAAGKIQTDDAVRQRRARVLRPRDGVDHQYHGEVTRMRAYAWPGLGAALLAAFVGGCSSPSPSTPSIKIGDESAEVTGFGYLAPGVHQATANLKSKSNSNTYGLVDILRKEWQGHGRSDDLQPEPGCAQHLYPRNR